MSKKLTPLQALEEIKDYVINGHSLALETEEKGFPLIETTLKETEKIKKCYKNELNNTAYYNNLALKYKKALEIIKEKKWLVEDILNAFIEDKEKYDLLKEVLK